MPLGKDGHLETSLIGGEGNYHRCFPKENLYPQESQRLKSFIVAMMIFIFKNNFSTTSRGHNENKTWKLSSIDSVIPFPGTCLEEQKTSSPLKMVKHIDNSLIDTCYPSLNQHVLY